VSRVIRATAELIGTALLVTIVIGSGIMAESLTSDVGVSLLLNQVATVAGLGVLIVVLMPISGAHINPVVTLAGLLRREISLRDAAGYLVAQLVGGIAGVAIAHIMFGRAVLELSGNDRLTTGTFVGEVVATSGLIAIIILLVHRGRESLIPVVVPAWIGAGYVFTSSTSFANPAVTVGRMFTDTFTGISPMSGLGFIGAQVVGMLVALAVVIPVINASQEKNHVR
jgi:glycerol uptake facilitator-like aquaporin